MNRRGFLTSYYNYLYSSHIKKLMKKLVLRLKNPDSMPRVNDKKL